MSLRDRDRLAVWRQVRDGLITAKAGAERVGLSTRQWRRLRRVLEAEGDGAVIHRLRGPSNHAKPEEVRKRVLKRAREPIFHGFRPTLLAEHLSRDPRIGPLSAHTLRRWLIAEGLWKTRRRGARHRQARPRRAVFGELVQWDSSEHAWLEDRYPSRIVLIKMIDDATNRLLFARFVPRDTGAANRQALIDYLRRHGRPVAFYTDKAGHFGRETRLRSREPLEERDARLTESIIRSALTALNTELILAHSPQAKGRIERTFGTSQDRLVKEMRVVRIRSIEAANEFLEHSYIPFWNSRFVIKAAQPGNAHRSLPRNIDLERLVAETKTRSVAHDFTIRYRNQRLQISKAQARGISPGSKLTIELRLDGSTRFRCHERYVELEPAAPPPPRLPTPRRPPAPHKQGPNHPWRTTGALVAKPGHPLTAPRKPAAIQPHST